jgi:hypothetical protein
VKIGFTDDLGVRHKALQNRYGHDLIILAKMAGDRRKEAEIHSRFQHLRITREEQFRPEPELMEFIDAMEEMGDECQ